MQHLFCGFLKGTLGRVDAHDLPDSLRVVTGPLQQQLDTTATKMKKKCEKPKWDESPHQKSKRSGPSVLLLPHCKGSRDGLPVLLAPKLDPSTAL